MFEKYKMTSHRKCELCNALFVNRNSLSQHVKHFHPSKPLQEFECTECNKTYKRKDHLTSHIIRFHKPAYLLAKYKTCFHCNLSFASKHTLNRHVRTQHGFSNEKIIECEKCKKQFKRRDHLTRHSKMHDESSERDSFECFFCSKIFRRKSLLAVHLGEIHESNDESSLECFYCKRKLSSKDSLKSHIRKYHGENPASKILAKSSKETVFKCGSCDISFPKKMGINEHYRNYHGIKIELERRFFESYDEFTKWKVNIQYETVTQFIARNAWKTASDSTRIFTCHRSGFNKSKGSAIKFPPRNGSKKLNMYCPAEISVKTKHLDKSCRVEYLSTHVGHDVGDVNELRFIHLDESERVNVKSKFQNGISKRKLRRELRRELLNNYKNILGDRHEALDYHEIRNIIKSHPEEKQNPFAFDNDELTVDAFVEKNKESILFYKKQMESDTAYSILEDKDFVLILMNEWQERNLRRYGHKAIAFDRMHELNRFEFLLYTLLVLDIDREGIPVCFLLTNRTDEIVIDLLLYCIRDRVGVVAPMTFMSDVENVYYNSWKQVMETIPKNHLFCMWPILDAWKKNLMKISNVKKKKEISNITYDLLLEYNPLLFEKKLKEFLSSDDTDLQEFVNYFRQNYAHSTKYWAYCFHQNSGLNTNMDLETFHLILKYNVGEKNKMTWLSHTVSCLEKYLMLREEDEKLISTGIHGKEFSKLDILRYNHHKARRYMEDHDDVKIVTIVDERSFFVNSMNDTDENAAGKIYVVSKVMDDDMNEFKECAVLGDDMVCRLPCELCQICFHEYTCNCVNASIKNNMCKHIHAVGIFLQNRASIEPELSAQVLMSTFEVEYDEDLDNKRRSVENAELEEENIIMEEYEMVVEAPSA